MAELKIRDFTEATLNGNGIFDVLMRATKAHLEAEYSKNRIKGPEYSTVYLGSLEAVMRTALEFLVQQQQMQLADAKNAAEVALLAQQLINTTTQNDNLIKEGCKLAAEFDVLMEQKAKVNAETILLAQKKATEQAQTSGAGVDPDSVIGRQKLLYQAQTDGFKREAETQAAKLLVDTWNVRRTTDEGTQANTTNKLDDATIGRAIDKLLAGVGA